MIKVHKSLRKALSILTFVGMFMSSTGVAFVPVVYAEDVLENQRENLEAGQGLESGGDSIAPAVLMDNNEGLDAPQLMGVQSFGPGFGFGYSKSKLKNKVINHLIEKFGGLDKPTICAEGDTIHISLGNKKESVTFSDLPNELIILLSFVGIESVSGLGLPECPSPEPEPDPEPSITLNTTKIVCEVESSLPNWQGSDSATGITKQGALDYIEDKDCEVVDNWNFQWAGGEVAPAESGSYVGTIDDGAWSTAFSGSTTIPVSALTGGSLSVREVLQDGYIPFTFDENNKSNADNVTAELYCSGAGHNYDNLEWVRGLTDGDEVDCVAFNAPTGDQVPENPQTATVEMCKLDTNENYLSGWQLALLGSPVKTTSVDSKENKASHPVNVDLPAGDYVAKATGTFKYRSGTNLTADARFSERLPSDATYGGPYSPWATSNSGIAWLHMDGDATVWGDVFSPSHTYYAPITLASDGDVKFYIGDNNHSDNNGNINVDIYNGYTGVTGDNGCVTFEDVPYGDYTVEELLQPEWENKSGLGAVTIDSEKVVLDVVNQGPEEPIGQCTLQGDAKWASEVVSFDQGKRKDGADVLAVRSDSSKALGVDDAADTNYDYVSLGFGGKIVLSFDYEIIDGPGDDFIVYETSTGNPSFSSYPEKADVYASTDGNTWVHIGEAQHDTAFDLDGKINNVRFIKIVDTSDATKFGADADGFDVAGVEILYCGDEIDNDEPEEPVVVKSQISISGTVYEDTELNDCYNPSTCKNEAGVLEGWTMRLYDSSWNLMQTAVSGADGVFKFSGFWVTEPGTVYVCEVLQDGWTQQVQTWSGSGYLVNTPNGSGETDEGPYCRTVSYTSTGNYSNASRFGNVDISDDTEIPMCVMVSDDEHNVVDGHLAVNVANPHANWFSASLLNPANWIWSSTAVEAPTDVDAEKTFIRTFTVDNHTNSAELVIAGDNGYRVVLNGTEIVNKLTEEFTYGATQTFDVTGKLVDGDNTLEITVRNLGVANTDPDSNPAGLLYKLTVDNTECEDIPFEPGSGDDGGDDNGNGNDSDDNQGSTSNTTSRTFASSRVLGDSTSTVEDDNGEVLGAATSVYPGMPNAGHTSAFSGSLVLAVQALVIGAALFFHNRKMFGTRVG